MLPLTVAAVLVAAAWPSAGDLDPAARSILRSRAVIALTYCDFLARDGRDSKELVMAVWGDGRAIWSDDPLRGGPPYKEGRVDPKRVAALLDKLTRDGLFDEKALAVGNTSNHFAYHWLAVRAGGRKLDMATQHELAGERYGEDRRGESRLAWLRGSGAATLFYGLVWADLRARLANLVPREGRPVSGSLKLVLDAGPWDIVWRDGREVAPPPRSRR